MNKIKQKKRIVIGISGASGAIYAARLLEVLQKDQNVEVHLVATEAGCKVLAHECPDVYENLSSYADYLYDVSNIGEKIASGSFLFDAMVIVPCSMKSLAAISCGLADNLLCRAADVALKEHRPLIIVPRETPLNAIHLENMLKLARLNVTILPACPGFYHQPQSIDELINIIVGKICDQLALDNHLFKRWGE